MERDQQYLQQEVQRQAHQQQQRDIQEHVHQHQQAQLDRYYEEQAAARPVERKKATEERV